MNAERHVRGWRLSCQEGSSEKRAVGTDHRRLDGSGPLPGRFPFMLKRIG